MTGAFPLRARDLPNFAKMQTNSSIRPAGKMVEWAHGKQERFAGGTDGPVARFAPEARVWYTVGHGTDVGDSIDRRGAVFELVRDR